MVDPSEREIARGITLLAGLPEQACQAFRQRCVNRILSRELFGCRAEESQTRNQFQGVGPAAHKIFDADSPGKVLDNRSDDFVVADTQDRITQVSASLSQILYGVGPRRRRATEAFDLGKYVPDPMTAFAAGANFREGCVVAGRVTGLTLVKSFQRHQIRGQRSENRRQRNLQANARRSTPNVQRATAAFA